FFLVAGEAPFPALKIGRSPAPADGQTIAKICIATQRESAGNRLQSLFPAWRCSREAARRPARPHRAHAQRRKWTGKPAKTPAVIKRIEFSAGVPIPKFASCAVSSFAKLGIEGH